MRTSCGGPRAGRTACRGQSASKERAGGDAAGGMRLMMVLVERRTAGAQAADGYNFRQIYVWREYCSELILVSSD